MKFLARIDEWGIYHSPNVCFVDPKEDGPDDHDAPEADAADEGAGEGDADLDGNGDEADAEESGEADPEVDDGEEDSGDVDEPAEAEEPPRRRSASEVIRDQKRGRKEALRAAEAARREAEEARREAAEAKRQAEEARRQAAERRQAELAEEEARRLEVMSESEKIAYYRDKDKAEHKREMDGVKFQIWDSTDRVEFRHLADKDPLIAKVRDKVEAEMQARQRQGLPPVAREILANQEIARMARDGLLKTSAAQRERGQQRLRREQVKPPRTRSDVAPPRQRRGQVDEKQARYDRLKDVTL